MNNFVFQNHTRIYFGKGVVKEYLAKLLEPYGKNMMRSPVLRRRQAG